MSVDGEILVSVHPASGNYQVPLDDVGTLEAAKIRIANVLAHKDAWVDQRVIDDLCRALRELKGHALRYDVYESTWR